MFCRNCGRELEEGSQYCAYCGQRTDGTNTYTSTNDEVKEETNKYGNKIYLRGAGLGFVLAFFASIAGLILAILIGDEQCGKAAIVTTIACVCATVLFFVIYFVFILLISGFMTFIF